MKLLLNHLIVGVLSFLPLYAFLIIFSFAFGSLGFINFYIFLCGLPLVDGLFFYYTSSFYFKVTLLQYIAVGLFVMIFEGIIERLYLSFNIYLGDLTETILYLSIILLLTVVIKIISDKILKSTSCAIKESRVNIFLLDRRKMQKNK